MDILRQNELTSEARDIIRDMFEYHAWNDHQKEMGAEVRKILEAAACAIIAYVPPSPDRSAAIRKLREARMDCNSAITHNGKY